MSSAFIAGGLMFALCALVVAAFIPFFFGPEDGKK